MLIGTCRQQWLYYSARGDRSLQLLLDHYADKNERCLTAVHDTAVLGHMEIMKLLIEHHAEVNAGTTGKSITVLHFVAGIGHKVEQIRCENT